MFQNKQVACHALAGHFQSAAYSHAACFTIPAKFKDGHQCKLPSSQTLLRKSQQTDICMYGCAMSKQHVRSASTLHTPRAGRLRQVQLKNFTHTEDTETLWDAWLLQSLEAVSTGIRPYKYGW